MVRVSGRFLTMQRLKVLIHLATMPDAYHNDNERLVPNLINDAILAYSDSVQRILVGQLPRIVRARIVRQRKNVRIDPLQKITICRESTEITASGRRDLNLIRAHWLITKSEFLPNLSIWKKVFRLGKHCLRCVYVIH
jgi:hypothetical protein